MGLFFFGTSAAGGSGGGIRKVADATARLALSPSAGDLVIQLDTNDLWYYNSALAWELYVEDFDNNDIDTVIAALAAHIGDTTAAHAGSAISFTPAGTIAATEVQSAIEEVATEAATNLSNHIGDTTDAHAASAIGFTPAGGIAATEVQSAIVEAASDAAAALSSAVTTLGNAITALDSSTDGRLDILEAATHAAVTIGAFGSAPDAKGASLSGQEITIQPADETHPGALSLAAQVLAGEKRFAAGVNVGSNAALAASEIFKVNSTTQGSRPAPSMTTAQRVAISGPATGLMVYDTDLKGALFYDGTQWQFMDGRATIAAAQTPADAATLTPLGYRSQILPVSGAAAAAVTLADLGIANALSGDELIIIGTSDTATVTLVAATNTSMNGSCTLGLDESITFKFYSSKWREVGRNA